MIEFAGPLLLDTHVWIWLVEGSRESVSDASIDALEAAANRGAVYVGAISVWEVAMLEAKGRISLSRSIDEWVKAALRASGVRLLPLTPEIAVESARLPGGPHADPADRMLVASSRVIGGCLATCDQRIIEYSAAGHLEVLDCRR